MQGIGTAGRSFFRRPWLKRGCCANDDDDDDNDDDECEESGRRQCDIFEPFCCIIKFQTDSHNIVNSLSK